MKTFTEADRFEYPCLREPGSWVLMLGAYKGREAFIFAERYGCDVVCYEPIREFHESIVRKKLDEPKGHLIHTVSCAVGAYARHETFGVKGELSGIGCEGNHKEEVTVVPILAVVAEWTHDMGSFPALVCMNIEGSEYEVLNAVLEHSLQKCIPRLQVQPHSSTGMAHQWNTIRTRLLEHYDVVSEDPNIDTGWLLLERKP